jgi:hypothetical protein
VSSAVKTAQRKIPLRSQFSIVNRLLIGTQSCDFIVARSFREILAMQRRIVGKYERAYAATPRERASTERGTASVTLGGVQDGLAILAGSLARRPEEAACARGDNSAASG